MACEGCNLSNKFHSLANVFAPVLLSVQYCLFVQCWPGSFLVQFREDLCHNNTAFAATSYYKKINQFGIKIAEKLCYSDGITLGFFPVRYCLESLGNIGQSFYLCKVVPIVLRHYWIGFFHVQCCLDPLRQHCTRFLPVECFQKNIKTTLNRIYSYVILSEAWKTTFPRVFMCAMLSQQYQENIQQDFFMCNVVWNLLGNITQGLFLRNVGPWLTDVTGNFS